MKVVLFCGGFGMRLHRLTENVPKPLVPIGGTPILLHLMKYYSHFGHKDFILCLGYKGEEIKKFFLNFNEQISGDFILSNGTKVEKYFHSEIEDWRITFAETGLRSPIGERLKKVEKYVGDDEIFLANYADGLSDLPLNELIKYSKKRDKIASLITVKPLVAYHYVSTTQDGYVEGIRQLNQTPIRINGGYFVFKNQIFDYINQGEDLVTDTFPKLIEKKQLIAYSYNGFWASMDTYKDKSILDEMEEKDQAKWEVWKKQEVS